MAALAFAEEGRSVALVGPFTPRRDGRTVAVLGASWRALEKLGVTQRLTEIAAPLATMRLVDDTGSLFRRPPTEFKASEIDQTEFGWNVETGALAEALLAACLAHPKIARVEAAIEGVEVRPDDAEVILSYGRRIAGRLVVGADGRKSAVRAAAGIEATEWSYPQAALTTVVAHTRPHRDVSTEFHTRQGPCVTVPQIGKRSAIVWLSEPREAERLMALPDEELALAIERRTHSVLGQMRIDGPRGLVPMAGLSVERFTAPRIALAGEACHVFPPIGAQGLNLGIRDVLTLVDAVSDDPGAPDGLRRYDASRGADVRTRTGAVDMLNRSLLADMLPVDFARGFGLLALDSIGPLRRAVMREGLSARAR